MDAVALLVALLLGGGGLAGAAYNWWVLRQQKLDRVEDFFWRTYSLQAESAEKRGDSNEASRIRVEYERQLEAYRDQTQLRNLVPPDRISEDE